MLHPDELTFQVTHQASELLMKGAAWELDRARICILQGDYKNAARLLRRANKMLVHPLRMLALLETITPYEYHVIRAGLGHGSGLDSPGFLALLHITPRLGEAFFDQVKARPASRWRSSTIATRSSSSCTRLPRSSATTTSRCSSSATRT